MRVCMYRAGTSAPRPGLTGSDELLYDLADTVTATGATTARDGVADIREIVTDWDRWRADVLGAIELVEAGGGPNPVVDGVLTVPFPNPVRDAFAIGGNYQKHVQAASKTTGLALTERKGAVFFMKPTGSFVGPTDDIEFDPQLTTRVDYEVELGVVLSRGGRDISADQAMEHVCGFMVVNDVSARDIMLRNKPQIDYFRGKGLDTFFPMGPGLTPRELVDHRALTLHLSVNGEVRQNGSTDDMLRGVPEIISELSKGLTLYPGDIIATGTPAGVAQEMEEPRFLQDGDVVVAEIAPLGRLENTVRARTRA